MQTNWSSRPPRSAGRYTDSGPWSALGFQCRNGAVGPPAATVGDPPDFLHIEVDHVPGPVRPDPAGPVRLILSFGGAPMFSVKQRGGSWLRRQCHRAASRK